MRGDEFRHLEHVDHALTSEHLLEVFVGVNVAFVCRVLKIVLLDVHPQLFDDF